MSGPAPAAGPDRRLRVGILVFDDVEVLDFAGPFEVFSRARWEPGVASRRDDASAPFEVFTVAAAARPVRAVGGLTVVPHGAFDEVSPIDILVIPGGFGTRPLLDNEPVLDWIRRTAATARLVTSVCTGALLLARAGLLRGRRATTHWGALDTLGSLDPTIVVAPDARVVEDGVLTSAGVAAGMDLAFTVVERFCGVAVAAETARYIEYPWPPGERAGS